MASSAPHILMTVDAVGGIWTYAFDLARALAPFGYRITLAVVGPSLDPDKRRAAAEAGLVVADLDALPEWLASGPDEVTAGGLALARLAERIGADLIHLNHPALAADVGFGQPVLGVCHSCVATWMEAVTGRPAPERFRWQAEMVGRGYRAATVLVAPSRAFAEATRRAYGLAESPVVVRNGRQGVPAPPATHPVDGAFTAGRLWDAGKNVGVLDDAAGLTSVAFRAAGPLRGPNGATVALRHLDHLGTLAEDAMRTVLAERPVYVSAALYEPFGLAILEAAQAGCALVLGDIPTLRELWGEAALFVAPTDAAGFAGAIERLLADPAARAAAGEAARERAARYTLEACAAGLLPLYDALLRNSAPLSHAARQHREAHAT